MKQFFWLVLIVFLSVAVKAQNLTPTDEGSKVHFIIKNLGFNTGGDLSGLKGSIKFDEKNISTAAFDVTVETSTIDTDNEMRDGHLKKEEYFDVAKYPVIHIVSTRIQNTNKPATYMFTGNLTIKGTTKKISFPFTVINKDNGKLFTGGFGINRRDFKVGGGSFSMSDNLKVQLSIYAH